MIGHKPVGDNMKITNVHNVPDQFVRYARSDKYSKGDADISVTQLIDAPRISILRRQHDSEMSKDITDMTYALLGTACHHILEQSEPDPNEIHEERLSIEMYGWKLSGAIDVQYYEADGSITIMDYKVTSAYAVMNDKPEWEKQLNCYAYLVQKNKDKPVDRLKIVAVIRDFSRRKSKELNYPDSNIQIIDVPCWTFEERQDYIGKRITEHQACQQNFEFCDPLPLCSDEERWAKPSKFAVMKKGRKSAVKLFDDQQHAELFIKNQESATALYIEHRVGEDTRCEENFCGVAEFCDQYKSNKTKGD